MTACGVAGCGHPLLPSSHPDTGKTAASLGKSDWPILGQDRPVLGVDLYALSNYPPAKVEAYGKRMLRYIKHVLQADAVGIVWNFYAPSVSSDASRHRCDVVSPKCGDPDQDRDSRSSAGAIPPTDHGTQRATPGKVTSPPTFQPRWFNNYYRAELPYLKIAQRFGVREFVTGTELVDLNSSPLWSSLFARISRVYHGLISYSAWDGNYFGVSPESQVKTAKPHLLPAKYVGMDMYWHAKIRPDATQRRLRRRGSPSSEQSPHPC